MRSAPSAPALALAATLLDDILALIWLLVCVLAIAALAYLFTKYVAGRGGALPGLGSGNARLKALARLPLGRDQALVLVQAGERYLLLGTAPSGVSLVAELTAEEAQALCAPPPGQAQPPSFGEALRSALKQRKPR